MQNIYQKIIELEAVRGYSKHQRLVNGIINAIDENIIGKGDMLPSVNMLIREVGFARETIVKAYKDLMNRGIIEAKNRLGYYVASQNTVQQIKVALMMYSIDTYQEQLYNSFRNELGENAQVDVFFHHNNIDVFETMLSHINGKYGMYVICPVTHPKVKDLLQIFPRNKFLMIDRYESLEGDFNHLTQEFEQSSYQVFESLTESIAAYDEMIFYCKNSSPVEFEIVRAFEKFIKTHRINGKIISSYTAGSLQKGKIYLSIDNAELWTILKDVKLQGYELGTDVGILSMNDEPIKELIFNGITTFSTDFSLIGKLAAQHVMKRGNVRKVIPTVLYRRKSL